MNICNNSKLRVNSKGIIKGIFEDKYGSRGVQKIKNMPIFSIPVEWSRGPCSTVSYAITLIDYDAIPVIGFPWIHWTVANIPCYICSIKENVSRKSNCFIEGVNSFSEDYLVKLNDIQDFRVSKKDAIGYGGFAPPDKPHVYTLKVYALNTKLNLTKGFFYNDMLKSMKNRVLAEGTFEGIYLNS
ncbi:YbhB/YbcL family Raf kinase inhibitor-like protein [Clostridium tarantellae]|uniref:YbhB/YbcL family Raf kinase inhibitor-like protein n=2 Tax=Clostridium tarantellae TaxID=39493 RepID=A0A6I1MYM6_9CLOT|nr:YbhB/YbcL family Raf kinase inhibitor-like protein [Clostridium tarantellae]